MTFRLAPTRTAVHGIGGEERLFGTALALIALQLVTVATLNHARADVSLSLVFTGLAPAMFVAFRHGGRMVRIVLTAPLGLAAAAAGLAQHAARIVAGTPEPVDYTGALLGLAGIALVGLAFHEALRGRGRSAKLLAIPAVLVLAQWFLLPVVTAGLVTNAHHHHVAGAASLGLPGARDVSFPAADGTPLAGWYVPGRRTSAVILLHGSHGTRADTLAHLRMLSAAGFGVLAFDARGHGQSEGRPNALGWRGSNDLAGAFDFVRRQPGVNPEGIAALGLSMGAEEALRAAAEGVPVEAVVADGAGASTTGDQQLVDGSPVATSVNWLTMRAVEALSGDSEPTPLKSVVGRVFVPTLLIASGAPGERTMAEHLRRRMRGDAAVWYVSDAGHTKALNAHPAAYRDSVVRFLDQASSRRLSSSW